MDKGLIPRCPELMGRSPKMLKFIRGIRKFAAKDNALLICGEPGTGREIAAMTLHNLSARKNGPFVVVDLSVVPHEKHGSLIFSNSGENKINSSGSPETMSERAEKGSLFFLEITDMCPGTQTRLADMIKNPGTEGAADSFNVRFLCSTRKELKEEVSNGRFNRELYELLRASQIKIPSLKERKEDILIIGKHFLQEACEKFETGVKEFSKDARDFLAKYDWPGNIRELEATIKRAIILSNSAVISKKDLMIDSINSFSVREFLEEKLKKYLKEMTKLENCNLYETVMTEVEKSLITIVLKETDGNQLKASKTLGINRNTLRAKVKEYKIQV